MAVPYDIRVRSILADVYPRPLDLDDLDAAGRVAADQGVYVTAVLAAPEEGWERGEPVPDLSAEVYVWNGAPVVRWTAAGAISDYADGRDTLAMRQVLARAQLIADLAGEFAAGRPVPMGELEGGEYVASVVTDRLVDEVAYELQASWDLAHCTEVGAPVLPLNLARPLARRALHRYYVIRRRDGADPLA
jgi:hypothetical protein